MKKIMSIFKYQLLTVFQEISILYISFYGAVVFLSIIFNEMAVSGLDIITVFFILCISMRICMDLKILIQNGFTRKYIYLSTLSLFVVVSAFLSIFDTIIYFIIHSISNEYQSFQILTFGKDSVIMNTFNFFLLYVLVFSISYFIYILWNKIGAKYFLFIFLTFGIICIAAITFFSNLATKNLLFNSLEPVSILIFFIVFFTTISYLAIRRIEVK